MNFWFKRYIGNVIVPTKDKILHSIHGLYRSNISAQRNIKDILSGPYTNLAHIEYAISTLIKANFASIANDKIRTLKEDVKTVFLSNAQPIDTYGAKRHPQMYTGMRDHNLFVAIKNSGANNHSKESAITAVNNTVFSSIRGVLATVGGGNVF